MRSHVGFFVLALGVSFAAAAEDADQAAANGSQGGPVAYTVMGQIKKLPNGGRPITKVAFPPISNFGTLRITLERGACLGKCPIYSVEIDGDGTVKYSGSDFVAIAGRHTSKIPEGAVYDLISRFRKADFFWLFDGYAANITDNPNYRVGIAFDGKRKGVDDYVGLAVGMPRSVVELEEAIDKAAGVKKWVASDADTMDSLRAEGWDFHANDDAHLRLLETAAQSGNARLVNDLLAAGISAKTRFGCSALSVAAENGDTAEVKTLIGAGAPLHWKAGADYRDLGCEVLQSAAQRGIPEIIRIVLNGHPDVNASWGGITALMELARNDFASTELKNENFGEAARLLIEAGAAVNARDRDGESAIMKAHDDPGLVRTLLRAGATDINRPDSLGRTPLMASADPDVSQALLEAGADPYLKDENGKTALDLAEKQFKTAPIVQRWMAAHPQKLPN